MIPIAQVLKPNRGEKFYPGRGFSILEVKQSGQKVSFLKANKITIDTRRKSAYPQNVEVLKNYVI